MSATLNAPYAELGPGGDYPIEANYGIRIYDNKGEVIPAVGEVAATLKGGLRTNYLGEVPILDGEKERVGLAKVLMIVAAKPENMNLEHILACGFKNIEQAVVYAKREHAEEFERDGVLTVFYYQVVKLI